MSRKESWINEYGCIRICKEKEVDEIQEAFMLILAKYEDRMTYRDLREIADLAADGAVGCLIRDRVNNPR